MSAADTPTPAEPLRQTYYVTVASNMPDGPGYYEIHAPSEGDAREAAFSRLPDGRWSFLYRSLDAIHPLDRIRLGVYHV